MSYELVEKVSGEVLDNITNDLSRRASTSISNGIQKVLYGKEVIEARKQVSLSLISSITEQKNSELQLEALKYAGDKELSIETLKLLQSLAETGELTEAKMLAIMNFRLSLK